MADSRSNDGDSYLHDYFDVVFESYIRKAAQEFGEECEEARIILDKLVDDSGLLKGGIIPLLSPYEPKRILRAKIVDALESLVSEDLNKIREYIKSQRRESRYRFLCERMKSVDDFMTSIRVLFSEVVDGDFPDEICRMMLRRKESRERVEGKPYIPWQGADVIITDENIDSYHGGKELVVTKYASSLFHLFVTLRDLDPGVLNHMNKYEFYGRMAVSVKQYVKENGDVCEASIMLVALTEAISFLEDKAWPIRKELSEMDSNDDLTLKFGGM